MIYDWYNVPQPDYTREKIKFISDYVMSSLHTGTPVKELVKEAKEAWEEIFKL